MISLRKIVQRVRGRQHGFIRRMVSPGDIGESIKPFVFLITYMGTCRRVQVLGGIHIRASQR